MIATAAIWLAIGFLGQALFSARFLVQWIASERTGRSIIPLAFWFLSKGGGRCSTMQPTSRTRFSWLGRPPASSSMPGTSC